MAQREYEREKREADQKEKDREQKEKDRELEKIKIEAARKDKETEMEKLKIEAEVELKKIEAETTSHPWGPKEKSSNPRSPKLPYFDEHTDKMDSYLTRFEISKVAKIRNRYNQVPHLTQDTNGKVTNSQKTPQTRAKRSALSQQVTTKHI